MSDPPRSPRWWPPVLTLLVLAAVWSPLRPGARDGFPLSTYPMFAYGRSSLSRVNTVLGVEADGRRRPLTPTLIAGTDRTNLALEEAGHAIRQGRAAGLCEEVAARVARSALAGRVAAIEVVADVWVTLEFSAPEARPQQRVVHARCEVP